jgi:hypothetical protein
MAAALLARDGNRYLGSIAFIFKGATLANRDSRFAVNRK